MAKHKRLSTKLSTIWQIIDYLSKKIDYRLIVDIIDTPGHPVNHKTFNRVSGFRKSPPAEIKSYLSADLTYELSGQTDPSQMLSFSDFKIK